MNLPLQLLSDGACSVLVLAGLSNPDLRVTDRMTPHPSLSYVVLRGVTVGAAPGVEGRFSSGVGVVIST